MEKMSVCVTTCVHPDGQMLMIYSLSLSLHGLETCDPLLRVLWTGMEEPRSLSSTDSFPHILHTDHWPRQAEGQSVQSLEPPSETLIIFPPHHLFFFPFLSEICLSRHCVCIGVSLSGVWSLGTALISVI